MGKAATSWGVTLAIALTSVPVAIFCLATGFALGTRSPAPPAWSYLATAVPVAAWILSIWASSKLHARPQRVLHWVVAVAPPVLAYCAFMLWRMTSVL